MDLKEFKFLSPVMNLTIDEVPTEEKQVEVTFTVNNLTDKIEPFILHRCEKHGWQLLETEEVSENQIKASFHSPGGPVAVVALSVNVMASGSITNAVDSNKVSAETTTRAIVGGKEQFLVEEVGVKLETVKPGMFSDEIQKEVDTLNQADAEAISGRGPTFECVCKPDLVAPGRRIMACAPGAGNTYAMKSGTSMSTPVISGAAALALEKDPMLTNVDIKMMLRDSADDLGLSRNQQGWGKFNCKKFLSL